MKIKRIEPIAVSLPMKKPVFMAGVEIRQADNVLIRIEADNGVVGWGEAASAPTMTGETVESMMAAAFYLTPALLGRPADDIAGTVTAMGSRMYGNNAAKGAIEMALHDLVGRATGKPAHALLGGKRRDRIALLGVISNGELDADLRDAGRKKAEGFRAFKIKVGIDKPLVDAARTRRVCELLGRDLLISSTPTRAGAPRRPCNMPARSPAAASTSSSSPCWPTTWPGWRRSPPPPIARSAPTRASTASRTSAGT